MVINSTEDVEVIYEGDTITYYSLNDPQSTIVEESNIDFRTHLQKHLDLSEKKHFYNKDQKIYRIISSKYNEHL